MEELAESKLPQNLLQDVGRQLCQLHGVHRVCRKIGRKKWCRKTTIISVGESRKQVRGPVETFRRILGTIEVEVECFYWSRAFHSVADLLNRKKKSEEEAARALRTRGSVLDIP